MEPVACRQIAWLVNRTLVNPQLTDSTRSRNMTNDLPRRDQRWILVRRITRSYWRLKGDDEMSDIQPEVRRCLNFVNPSDRCPGSTPSGLGR